MEQWPIVGRDELLDSALALIDREEGGGVLLLGEAGVGKSTLANEIARRLEADGVVVARVAGDETSAGIPLAGLSHLLPPDLASRSMVDGQMEESAMFHLARSALEGWADGRPLVVFADDANWLDELSVALLGQLARSGSISLVATVRGLIPPAGVLERWVRSGLLSEIAVPPLGREDIRELLRAVLGPVGDGRITVRVSEASRGVPLFIKEILRASIDGGALAESNGRWTLRGPIHPSARLTGLVEQHLEELTAEQHRVLEAVALAGSVGVGVIGAIAPPTVLEELEARGLIEVRVSERRATLHMSHPLYGEVLRRQIPALRARSLRLALSDAIEEYGARRREDAMRIASWRLDAGLDVREDVLLDAARLLLAAHDLTAAERTARKAWDHGRDPAAGVVLMAVLFRLHRPEELEALGAELSAMDLSEEQLVAVARQRALNLFFGYGRSEAVSDVIENALSRLPPSTHRDRLRAHHVQLLVNMGWPLRALAEAEGLQPIDTPEVQVELSGARAMALSMVGRTTEAIESCDAGLALIESHGRDGRFDQRALLAVAKIIALTYDGRTDEAAHLAERARQSASQRNASAAATWFAHWTSWVAILRGDVPTALEYAREFASWARERGSAGNERWGLAIAGMAHLLRGDVDAARPAVERAIELEVGSRVLFHPDIDRAVVWLAMAEGRLGDARDRLDVSVARSRKRGRSVLEALSLYDHVRMGSPELAAGRLAEIAESCDSPLVAALAGHAVGMVDRSPAEVGRAVDRFERCGFLWNASEAAMQQSALYGSAGADRDATAARVRSGAIAASVGGLMTPPRRHVDVVTPLTRREEEIAVLAARGQTSKDIAAELVVSVRTVETHLQRAYMKLGIRGRNELAEALSLS